MCLSSTRPGWPTPSPSTGSSGKYAATRPYVSDLKYERAELIGHWPADKAKAVLEIAAQAPFGPIGPHYPGIRSPVPEGATGEMTRLLAGAMADTFALPAPPKYHECFLSLVTAAPATLALIQRLPRTTARLEQELAGEYEALARFEVALHPRRGLVLCHALPFFASRPAERRVRGRRR